MHLSKIGFLVSFFIFSKSAFAQHEGIIVAPEILVGYNHISNVYHPNPEHAPANRGFNIAFQFGGVAGYKWENFGILVGFKNSHFPQNFRQGQKEGDLKTEYLSYSGQLLYQLGAINNTRYYHTLKLGYALNTPISADYIIKNSVTGEVYADTSQTNLLQNNHMILAEYGISTGYKLLWADFSLRAGVGFSSIYKPLTNTNGINFFLGFQIAFGLFYKTNN